MRTDVSFFLYVCLTSPVLANSVDQSRTVNPGVTGFSGNDQGTNSNSTLMIFLHNLGQADNYPFALQRVTLLHQVPAKATPASQAATPVTAPPASIVRADKATAQVRATCRQIQTKTSLASRVTIPVHRRTVPHSRRPAQANKRPASPTSLARATRASKPLTAAQTREVVATVTTTPVQVAVAV